MDQISTMTAERPMWRRITEFPLVAMVIGVVIYLFGVAVSEIVGMRLPPIPGFTLEMKVYLVSVVLLPILYVFVIARLGCPKRNDFDDRYWLRRLLIGLVGGTLIFSAAVAVAGALGIYKIVGVGSVHGLLAALIVPTVGAAVTEEMMFRGILFRWIEQFGGSWLALLLTSAFFGASHLMNPNASLIAAFGIAIEAGILLGGAYMLSRSLWLPMGLHAAWNFTQGEVWDIPVSGTNVDGLVDARLTGNPLLTGNGFGLEASVIVMVVATAVGIWLVALAVRKGEVIAPMWSRIRD